MIGSSTKALNRRSGPCLKLVTDQRLCLFALSQTARPFGRRAYYTWALAGRMPASRRLKSKGGQVREYEPTALAGFFTQHCCHHEGPTAFIPRIYPPAGICDRFWHGLLNRAADDTAAEVKDFRPSNRRDLWHRERPPGAWPVMMFTLLATADCLCQTADGQGWADSPLEPKRGYHVDPLGRRRAGPTRPVDIAKW